MKAHGVLCEAAAMREGLCVVVSDGVRKIQIKSESTAVVSMIDKKCVAPWSLLNIMHAI